MAEYRPEGQKKSYGGRGAGRYESNQDGRENRREKDRYSPSRYGEGREGSFRRDDDRRDGRRDSRRDDHREYGRDRRDYGRHDHRDYDRDDRRTHEERGERRDYGRDTFRDDRRDERRGYRDDSRREDSGRGGYRQERGNRYRDDNRGNFRDERRDSRPSYRDEAREAQWDDRRFKPGPELAGQKPSKQHHHSRIQRGRMSETPKEYRDTSLFLPMSREDMEKRGWSELDVLLVSGDAYVDHPSFGIPLLGRWLEAHGFKVGIVAQPRWDNIDDIARMGRPRLFAGVTSGAVDSMLAHYTAFRKKRHDDAYTPGGKAGARPNRAVSVYTSLIRRAFPALPVVAGGIEASLRRISHYDFWTDSLRKSLLPDAKLDLIVYGMGETAILECAQRLDAACTANFVDSTEFLPREEVTAALAGIHGTARMVRMAEAAEMEKKGVEMVHLPSHAEIAATPAKLVEATLMLEKQVHHMKACALQPLDAPVSDPEKQARARAVLLEIPATPLPSDQLDSLYSLPFTRRPHPSYREEIPAVEMMLTSMTCHRGCGGGCSFCSLALHQGRRITSRSKESLMEEARLMASRSDFTGSISDVGGPSANMWKAHCRLDPSKCRRSSCMFPKICPGFDVDQREHINLLHEISRIKGIHHVRVASGVRFDLALKQKEALEAYAGEFTGGQLKVAPEHCAPDVLKMMRKPNMDDFEVFLDAFRRYSEERGKEQYVIPYLMSAFPGCTDEHMRQMKEWLAARHWSPRQVQCFIPTPGTVATAMFYAEVDMEGKPLYVAKTDAARLRQHGILLGTAIDGGSEWDDPEGHGRRSGQSMERRREVRERREERGSFRRK